MNIQGLGSSISVLQAGQRTWSQRQDSVPPAAISANTVNISAAAKALFSADRKTDTIGGSSPVAVYDTDQGPVSLNIDDYFSTTPTSPTAELPPLLMPTQGNIDALSAHISATFPKFLSDHGIPSAPASISYDRNGEPVFPADYPYSDQLKEALAESPVMARELSTVTALSEFKALLDESLEFQKAYSQAKTQQEIEAVLEKFSDLFSGENKGPRATLNFSTEGKIASISLTHRLS